MKRYFIAISLVLIMSFSTVSFADNSVNSTITDTNESVLQGGDIYYTEDYQNQIKDTNEKIDKYLKNKNINNNSSLFNNIGIMSSGSNSLSVPLYLQEQYYYCGPASTQMVLKYVTGVKYSQSTLASSNNLNTTTNGTYVYKVTEVLNKYITTGQYQHVLTSRYAFGNSLIYSIDGNRPVICHVNPQYLPNYTGTATGHYLVSKGYSWGWSGSNYYSTVYYNDSNDDHYGTFDSPVSAMENAINQNAGYYIRKI